MLFDYNLKNVFLAGLTDKSCPLPRGRGVGGSSLINALFYSRGNKRDYEIWADLLDDPKWSYDSVLPYLIEQENFTATNPYVPIDVEYHGYEGPIRTTQAVPPLNVSINIIQGGQELGYNVTDYNGRQQMGSSIIQFTINNGRRVVPSIGFIDPIRKIRDNLVVLDSSYVIKIEINTDTKEAEGVVFTRYNKTYIARNHKEVILSAGSYSSPQILMLSGIGPQEHLEDVGIPVIVNLPVGENLHDHTITILRITSNITNFGESAENAVKDFLGGIGSLTRSFPVDAINWFQTPIEETEDYPDTELVPSYFEDYPLVQKLFGWTDQTLRGVLGNSTNSFVIFLTPCHQKSKGSVTLKSSDPYDYPNINPNFLSDEKDMKVLYESVKLVQKLTQTQAFRKMNFTLAVDSFPGCDHFKKLSKKFWYCYFRQITGTAFHPVGTCSTGTGPESGVVDKNLKVFGIEGLRVADASVIPFNFAAHINAICYVIGAKVSDLIKNNYQ